jgi:curved DNA-binding protein CbpA
LKPRKPADYYKALGLRRDAQSFQIEAAYRRLAMKHHPDRNPGDKRAERRMKAITEAYEALRDPVRRAAYDATGHAGITPGVIANDPLAGLMEPLTLAFQEAVSQLTAKGADWKRTSAVGAVKEALRQMLESCAANLTNAKRSRAALVEIAGRITRKDEGENLLAVIAKEQMRQIDARLPKLEAAVAQHRDALEFVDHFGYRLDEMADWNADGQARQDAGNWLRAAAQAWGSGRR